MRDTVTATISGHLGMPDGHAVLVEAGREYDATDPVVKQHPNLFAGEPAAVRKSTKPAAK